MILRLCRKIFFQCGQQNSIKTINYKLNFHTTIKEQLKKCFQLKYNQKIRLFHTFKFFGLYSTGPLFFVKNVFCKTISGRTNPLLIKNAKINVTWSDLWKLIYPHICWLVVAALGALLVAFLNIKIPILLGQMINLIARFLSNDTKPDFSLLQPIGLQLCGLYIGQAIFTFIYITCLSIMGERIASDLRVKLFNHLLHLDLSFYDVQMTGELNDRLNFDVQEFKSCFKLCVSQGLRTFTQTTGCIVSLFLMSPEMTFLTVAVLPLVILVGSIFGRVLRKISNTAQTQSTIAMVISSEAFSNIRTVKEFAMEDGEKNLYKEQLEKSRILNEKLGAGIGAFQAATNLFLNGIILGTLYIGAQLIAKSNISPGDLMSFLVTTQTIQRSLTQLSLVFGNTVKGYTACARVHEFLNIKPSNVGGTLKIPDHSFFGNLFLEDVSFAYATRPEQNVISNFSLKIMNGETIAICGPSGSGKSTIASLIERLYEPKSGRILLDGIDLTKIDQYWLRKKIIGVISQEPVLFATTIEENIRYGKYDATDDEVRQAARLANADVFIDKFSNGYKTLVGERGVTLSGGQKQRIAIARALLKNPPILILDEATSALDAENEKLVQDALEKVSKNRTVIIIAHRLSTIRSADKICVIKNGKLIEQGNHDELLLKKGAYHKLIKLQQTNSNENDLF